MSIEKLDYFISAATNSSFTKAARECGVAQSAISQQIASLEKELECELFARSGRHVRLTGKGEYFLEQAKKLQEQSPSCAATAKASWRESLITSTRLNMSNSSTRY